MNDNVTTAIGEFHRHAKQVLQAQAQSLTTFGRNEEEHETAATGSEELAAQRPRAAARRIDFVEIVVGDFLSQSAFDLPTFVEQVTEVVERAVIRVMVLLYSEWTSARDFTAEAPELKCSLRN